MNIKLPFPPASLSPNKRLHWAALAKHKKAYRAECFLKAKSQGVGKSSAGKLHVSLTFHPPDKRRRDQDNMLAAMKSGLDGLSDAIGVDDRNWQISFQVADQTGNFVSVEIQEKA